jgi:hypothetical protein
VSGVGVEPGEVFRRVHCEEDGHWMILAGTIGGHSACLRWDDKMWL